MSLLSITIRLEFGDGSPSGVSHSITLPAEAPTPMGGGVGLLGVPQASLPTPFTPMAASTPQEAVPTPMSGMGDMSAAIDMPPMPSLEIANAAMGVPPVPSLDIASAHTADIPDDIAHPEGAPEAVTRPPRGR